MTGAYALIIIKTIYVSEIKCPKCGLTARGFCRDNKERSLKSAMVEWENLIVKLNK